MSTHKKILTPNPLEILRESVKESAETTKREILSPFRKEFLDQILSRPRKTYSGELTPGQPLEMKDVFTGNREIKERESKVQRVELRLREEEMMLVSRRSNELSLQIEAIHDEVSKIAHATPQLSKELELAAIMAPNDPSSYQLFFLKHVLSFIMSFRKNIENASVWFNTANGRAAKKNVWGANYKKYGARYLLSGEHYSGRAAA
jgi:hypothetical protein